jgi:hypothetical protein
MKKAFILLLSLGLFLACNNNKDKGVNDKKNTTQGDDYRNNNGSNTGDNTNTNSNNNDFNTGGGWSSSDVSSFNAQCLTAVQNNRDLARKFCPCLLEKFQKRYNSLAEMDKNSTEAEGTQAATQCKEQLGIDDNNSGNNNTNVNGNTDNGGWTRSQEQTWLKSCVDPLVEKMGEDKTNTYCNCMLEKIKQQFSSYDDANTNGTYEIGVKIGKICLKEMGLQ